MNNFKNKKILLVCKETFSYPMYFLGKKLEKEGNDVAYYFVHNSEVIYNKSLFNKTTYYYFKDNIDNNKIFDVRDINLKFIENYKNAKPDMDYLNNIEHKYGKNKNLNQQIISSQMTSTPYHNRWFWCELTYEQTLYWLELNYKNAEKLLTEFAPNIILDLDTAEIQRTILNEICTIQDIPYITIEFPRYETWIIPTCNLGLEPEKFFVEKYNDNLTANLEKEIKDITDFANQDKIMAKRFKNDSTSSYKYSIKDGLKHIILSTYATLYTDIISKNIIVKKFKLNLPLYSNPIKSLSWHYLLECRKIFLFSIFNKYFEKPENEDYVYMPLHLIPESTTFVKSPMYIDELSIIQSVSKSLPIGWKLYVKEHQAMLGERPLSFYKDVKKLYNVKLVKLNYYNDPKPWIVKSKGVITISGSTALEARLLSKPSAVFGHVCFNIIDGIDVINSIRDLKDIFIEFDNFEHSDSDIKSCAAYIKTIKDVGVNLDIKKLIISSARCISKKELEKERLDSMIDKLLEFYEKAYYLEKS